LHMSEQKLPGWRSWHVYRKNGPLRRFNEREGMLAALTYLLKRADDLPTWQDDDDDCVVLSHKDDDDDDDSSSWTSDENLVITIGDYQQEEDEEVSRQVREMDIEEAYDPEDPVVDVIQADPVASDPANKEKNKERVCNERQEFTMEEALAKIELSERIYVVEQEKVKTYQAMVEKKEEKIDTLEAEVKAKKESIEFMEATIKYLKGRLESEVKAKNERIDYLESSIKYLKNVYKAKEAVGGNRS
jgi:hypothetical protein